VASPDTEELAIVPQPAGAPDAETAPQERVAPDGLEPERLEREPAEEAKPDSEIESQKERGRWWRGFTGSLAAGLVVLAVGVYGVAVVCLFTGAPGPGAALLAGHPVAAGLALVAQRVADRRSGLQAAGAGLAVVLFTISALTLFWLT
jgi:hypothetical protein